MDIEALLAPISADQPCGEDLAFSSELDAIARARQADDPSLEQGAWVTQLKEADWKFVGAGCQRLLATRSKDLRLAVWLAEAAAHTDGFGGLAQALTLSARLCERFWDGLYPLAEDGDHEQRIGNLCWIAARVAYLAKALPVTASGAVSLNLIAFARSHAEEEGGGASGSNSGAGKISAADIDKARRATPSSFYRRLLDDCAACEAALVELEKVVDARLGADGPGFSAARAALQDVSHFAAPLAAGSDAPAAPVPVPVSTSTKPVVAVIAPAPQMTEQIAGPLSTRAEALAQLRAVAMFFRQTEPHSPVAYLADKAAHWGEQPLHVWLRAVIKDDLIYGQLEEMLGANKPAV